MTTDAPARALTPRIGQHVRRARFWVVVGVVVVALLGLQVLLSAGGSGGTFGPDSAAPAGGRALAQVLRQQGVTVTAASEALPNGTSTLLVDDADALLTGAQWRTLLTGRARVVVVSPGFEALRQLAPEVRQAGTPNRRQVDARCGLTFAGRAGSMSLTDVTQSLRSSSGEVCFPDARGAGQVVTLRTGTTRVVLLADRTAFTNEHIGSAGNAAVALNALGATGSLTWFTPDASRFLPTGPATLQDLTPAWVTPVAALLLLAGLAAAIWKGRRFGPIVVERLPVSVRSRETVEGRARLYASGSARLRAADALRIGTIGRIAPMLGLSRSAPVADVVDAAARTTGRRTADLQRLLLDQEPQSDRDLVQVSDDLARLEAAVRTAVLPGATGLHRPDEGRGS